MAQIKTLSDLQAVKQRALEIINTRVKGNMTDLPQIKIAMATSGIAAGAKEIFDYIVEQTYAQKIDVVVTQTGVLNDNNLQPVIVELTLPNQQPKLYENVDKKLADEIINSLKA